MNLKAELLRGMYYLPDDLTVGLKILTKFSRCLRLWFRASFRYPAAGYHAHHQR